MDFNEVIDRRKTSREWTDREVAYDTIKKILEAGMKAPSWDHYRNWQFSAPASRRSHGTAHPATQSPHRHT